MLVTGTIINSAAATTSISPASHVTQSYGALNALVFLDKVREEERKHAI